MSVFLYCFNLEIQIDTVVSHIYYDSNYHDKCEFASKFIQLVTITNTFPFQVVQNSHHCQFCVLQENLIGTAIHVNSIFTSVREFNFVFYSANFY